MWGDPTGWLMGSRTWAAGSGTAPPGGAAPAAPLAPPLAPRELEPHGTSPLLHSASSAPAPATVWVPDGPAAAAASAGVLPLPLQPAASAPLPAWLPPSPFCSAAGFDPNSGGAPQPLQPAASAPLPLLSPFSTAAAGGSGDMQHALHDMPPLAQLHNLPSTGFSSVTSPLQLGAVTPPGPQLLVQSGTPPLAGPEPLLQPTFPSGGFDSVPGMHQPVPPPLPPGPAPSPFASSHGGGAPLDGADRLLRQLLHGAERTATPPLPVAAPPEPKPLPRRQPLSPAACLTAAVLAKRPVLVRRLLTAGAPCDFRFGDLPESCAAVLEASGISLAGCQHMTPLMAAVRQLSTDVALLLLEAGAAVQPAPPDDDGSRGSSRNCSSSSLSSSVAGRPLLLLLLDAAAGAAAEAAAAAAAPAPGATPGAAADASPAGSAIASGSDHSSLAGASSSGFEAISTTGGSAAVLDASCRLLEALLAHGADPLEQDPTAAHRPTTFLSECLHPALLRPAVTHVQRQCQAPPGSGGRRLTPEECQQLLSAGRRAYAD